MDVNKTYSLFTEKAQMDMVIERADGIVNICELKYTQQQYALDKAEAEKMTRRMDSLRVLNRKRQNVQCILVTKQEAKQNSYYNTMITNNITLSKLMK